MSGDSPGSINIPCPQCGTAQSMPQSLLGASVECSYCHYRFSVFSAQPVHTMVQHPPAFPQSSPYPAAAQPDTPGMPPVVISYQPYAHWPSQQLPLQRQAYSWEIYPFFYPMLPKRKRKPHPSVFKAASLLLLVSATFALISAAVFAEAPVLLGFGGKTSLGGTVFDDLKSPVSRANVTLDNSISVRTDINGKFSFPQIACGEHALKVEKSGYDVYSASVFVIKGLSDDIKISVSEGTGGSYHDMKLFSTWQDAYAYFYAHSIILAVLWLFMVAGAIFIWKRKRFGVAAAGSALAAFMWFLFINGFFALDAILISGSAFGIAAFALVLIYRKHFSGYDD